MIYLYKKVKNSRSRKQQQHPTFSQPANDVSEHQSHELQPTTDNSTQSVTDSQTAIVASKKAKKILTPEEKAEKKRRRIYQWKLVIGLFGPFALQALDTTIVASALAQIADDFHEIKQLNWIISSFNLTSAAFLFFWAQMADIFGRHVTVQAAIIVMMVGSAICTGAPTSSFSVLLLGRAIQGIGCSGVNISVRTILADRVSLSEFASNWTTFVLISGVSFGLGPLIGGYLTQSSWRWVFAINLPIAFISIFVVALLLRKELVGPQPLPELSETDESSTRGRLLARLATIDFGGQMLFLWGLGLLLLALTWGGSTYSWSSVAVLAPLIIGSVLTVLWILYERSMSPGGIIARVFPRQRAMMPWELLSQRDNLLVFFINFGGGMAMFAVMYFADLYFTLVEGKSTREAGLALLYYMPGLTVGVYMAILSSNTWPRQTLPPLVLGSIITAVGITVLAWAMNAQNSNVVYGMMALIGTGVALRMNPASLHCLAYFPDMTARIACLSSFSIPFGGLVGLTIMSTVFNNKSGTNHTDPKEGIYFAYVAMIPFMWICVILSLCIGNVWLLKGGDHEVLRGSYLLKLITGKKLETERLHREQGGWSQPGDKTNV